jgi:peptidoglycan L-alanyl-D-glutamate endopeptidase CwlK
MASRKISDLKLEFAKKIYQLEDNCAKRGINILFYCTYRSAEEQAKLFRRGRSYEEIKEKKQYFINMNIPEISEIIESVGPQRGEIITNAAPFESWHQYGEAVDGVPLEAGKVMWNDIEKYNIYGEEAIKLNLTWAGNWISFKEYPHIQFRSNSNPFDVFSIHQIKELIKWK